MRFGRSDAAAAAGNGRLFVSGGFDGRDSLSSVEMYLPSANSWTEVVVLPYRVTGLLHFSSLPIHLLFSAHAMLHNGSSLIVLGGVTGDDRTPRSVENKVRKMKTIKLNIAGCSTTILQLILGLKFVLKIIFENSQLELI